MRTVVAAALIAAAGLPAAAYEAGDLRGAMRTVFASMRVLLDHAARPGGFDDPGARAAALAAAGELEAQAALVSGHAPRDEVSFLAGSLDRYAAWIRRSIEWRRPEAARRLVHDAVNVCIACHTRLPSRRDSPVARDFLEGAAIAGLPVAERARLQVATRRFDDAMRTLEEWLAGAPDAQSFERAAREYLVVSLRVKGDPRRARRTFARLAAGGADDGARRERLRSWAGALQRLELHPPVAGDLDAARALVREAEALAGARRGDPLVAWVTASRPLYEYLDGADGGIAAGAEAYYLLGLSHYRIEPDSPLPQAELYLEKAIRTAPAGEPARRALALLRTKLEEQHAAGGGLPADIADHLRMLRELVAAPG